MRKGCRALVLLCTGVGNVFDMDSWVHRELTAGAGCRTGLLVPLQTIVNDPLMRNSAVLVFANKQDCVSLCHRSHFTSPSTPPPTLPELSLLPRPGSAGMGMLASGPWMIPVIPSMDDLCHLPDG